MHPRFLCAVPVCGTGTLQTGAAQCPGTYLSSLSLGGNGGEGSRLEWRPILPAASSVPLSCVGQGAVHVQFQLLKGPTLSCSKVRGPFLDAIQPLGLGSPMCPKVSCLQHELPDVPFWLWWGAFTVSQATRFIWCFCSHFPPKIITRDVLEGPFCAPCLGTCEEIINCAIKSWFCTEGC